MRSFPQLLLICGMPATGKTTFGNWLRDEHGYVHLDLESRDCLEANGLPQFWPERIWNLDESQLADFYAYLRSLNSGTVMTWAFHTDLIPLVRDLVRHGCQPWWFEGDRLASRKAHEMRKRVIKQGVAQPGEPNMQTYDSYVASLVQHWAEIAPIFGDNIIHTLHPDDTRLPYKAIWDCILHMSIDNPHDQH